MEMDVQQIIADPTLSPEAKVILVTGEIERHIRETENKGLSPVREEVKIELMHEGVLFHPYLASFIPRAGELISCRLEVGKGLLATLWRVTQVEHGVGMDQLALVTISVEPADSQTAMHWRRSPRKNAE